MTNETKEIYSEVYQVLNLLGDEYINRLPKSLVNMLNEKRKLDYNPEYTDDVSLSKQNIRKKSLAIIVLLYLNYWCENENEVLEAKQILLDNEEKYQKELREKYNPDNIFENYNQRHENIIENNEEKDLAVPQSQSLMRRILNKIKNIFRKKIK